MDETSRALHPWDELPDIDHPHRTVRDWTRYYEKVRGNPPRETLLAALDAFEAEGRGPVPDGQRPLAVDLGCGDGRDTVELLRRGWRVFATDGHPEALGRLVARPDIRPGPQLTLGYCLLEAVEVPAARLISFSYSLPFCLPERFGALWGRMRSALEPGGRLAGQLFGDRHTWAKHADRTHHTAGEVGVLLEGLEIEQLETEERDGEDATGRPVHWHLFHVVARRPMA